MSSSISSRRSSVERHLLSRPLPSLTDLDAERARRHLGDFIPWATTAYAKPKHLAPLLERFDRAMRGEPQRVYCHAPPGHYKTETVLHVPAWVLSQRPTDRLAYITYGADLAHANARKARDIAQRIGVTLDTERLDQWTTPQYGGLWSTGTGGPLTGKRLNWLLVDDAVKSRVDAESPTWQNRTRDWWNDVARTRMEPGSSIFVFMTRWTSNDLPGYLLSKGFEHIHLPAISDDGEALCPERFDLKALEEIRHDVGEYTWASLYQGRPRPRGGTLFGDPGTFSEYPPMYRAAFGVDLSYSAKTSSDWSVAVKMLRFNEKYFVVHVSRKQVRAPRFKKLCRRLHKAEPAAPWLWYTSTTEQGVADLFQEGPRSVPLKPRLAKGDKFTRAQKYAAAWNRGDVLVPQSAPWLEEFLSEHLNFTGQGNEVDDTVDAAVAAFDALNRPVEQIPDTPISAEPTGLAGEAL